MDRKPAEISWFSMPGIGVGTGYGYAAYEMITSLQKRKVKVSFQSDSLELRKSSDVLTHISFTQPDFYQGINDQYKIGYTPWESDEVPDVWIPKMRAMDEVWTTSAYNAEVYKVYDVNSIIKVIPHGIDPEVWSIESRYFPEQFIFFHVGGPTDRKGGQKVVDAFLKLFDGNKDVHLLMKSNGVSETRYYDKYGEFGNANRHEQITIIEQYLEVHELVKLYNSSHCLVYPTNGEGFGMIPFQGIASGLPTICTDATGCADFASLSVPLDSKPTPGVGLHLGNWVEPDFDDLCDKMLYVYNNYDKVAEKTNQSARVIHSTQTWDHIADKILDNLGDKIYQRV